MTHRLVIAGLLAATLAGCNQPRAVYPPAAGQDPVNAANYPRIVMLDGLQKWVVADTPRVDRSANGVMRVVVPIRSISTTELNTQYRFQWLDGNGMPLEPEADWQYIRLPVSAQEFAQGSAMDSRAVDWRLQVRPAR